MRLPPPPWRLIGTTAALIGLAGCSLPSFGAPDAASEEGESILSLWQGFFVAALLVGALVWGLLTFVLLRYRRRARDAEAEERGELPSQNAYNIPLEIFYTVAPVVAVAVLFGFSWATERDVNALSDEPAVDVEVIGFKWSWEFRYPDDDIVITGEDGEAPELVLPVGRPTHLKLVSADVAHSFWTPEFLNKRDLVPGVDNEIEVTPTEIGTYQGRCAEYCGLDHWQMYYTVRVVSEDDFQAWLDDERPAPEGSGTDEQPTTTPTTGVTETTDVPGQEADQGAEGGGA